MKVSLNFEIDILQLIMILWSITYFYIQNCFHLLILDQDSYIHSQRLARLSANNEWRTSSNCQRPTYGSHSSPPSNSNPNMLQYPNSSYPSAPLQTEHQVPPDEFSNSFSPGAEGYSPFTTPLNNKGNASNLRQQEPYNPNFNPNYRPTYEDPPPPYPGNIWRWIQMKVKMIIRRLPNV